MTFETELVAGESRTVLFRGLVGDGPFGSAGTGTGGFDFYRVNAAAGQRILVDVDTPIPFFIPGVVDLDPMVGIYDSLGRLLEQNDDNLRTFESRLAFVAPAADSYDVNLQGSFWTLIPESRKRESRPLGHLAANPYGTTLKRKTLRGHPLGVLR